MDEANIWILSAADREYDFGAVKTFFTRLNLYETDDKGILLRAINATIQIS